MNDVRANITPSDENLYINQPPSNGWFSFSPVTLLDISGLLAVMKLSSSPLDYLPKLLFFKTFDAIVPCIAEIINQSLLTGIVPNFFKQVVVELKLKKPNVDHTETNNYRPISKLPFLHIILEKMVAEQLTAFIDENSILDMFQSGF